jgi:hypothetical protein
MALYLLVGYICILYHRALGFRDRGFVGVDWGVGALEDSGKMMG